MSTLKILWDEAEKIDPTKDAICYKNNKFTYRNIGKKIRKLKSALKNNWVIGHSTIVALIAPNCPEFVITYFAVVSLGAIIIPIDERMTSEEINQILIDSNVKYIIVHNKAWEKLNDILRDSSMLSVERILTICSDHDNNERFEDFLNTNNEETIMNAPKYSDVAELMYTSGTSGVPKPVMRTHANVIAASKNAIIGFQYHNNDILAVVMPLSHSSALTSQMLPLIQIGGTIVLIESFENRRVIKIIKNERVTCLRAAPTMLRLLLCSKDFTSENLESLRLIINSSASIDSDTIFQIKKRFINIELMNSYGLTEASTCTIIPDSEIMKKPESIGYPIEGVEMCIMDENGKVLKSNREGEICIKGDHVFSGYLNRPIKSKDSFFSGWLKSGDLGYRDSEGYYYLKGRRTNIINCSGKKVEAQEVENCILQIKEVTSAAVIGVKHHILGKVVKAFVVPKEENKLTKKQIKNHCAKHLSSHKIPFYVEIVKELPTNSAGKILHSKLNEWEE